MSVLTSTDRRELYKAMRSAHDGICPICGGKTKRRDSGLYYCLSCDFILTKGEVQEIRSWHADFHRDIADVLAKWRKE